MKRSVANEGVEVSRDIEMRVEGPPDSLDGHERADQEDQIRRNVQVVARMTPISSRRRRPRSSVSRRELGVRRDDFADIAAVSARIDPTAPSIERVQGTDHSVGVL